MGRPVILVALGCLISIESAFAQSPTDAHYGFVAGVSRHTWTSVPREALGPTFTARPDFGPGFGLYVDGLASRRIGITVEALLMPAGSAINAPGLLGGVALKYDATKTDVPSLGTAPQPGKSVTVLGWNE